VTPYPERSRALGHPGAVRVIPDTIIQSVNGALDQSAGGGDWLQFESGMLLLSDRAKLVAQGVNVDSVVADVATRLRAMAGVARVDRPAAFTAKDTADPVSRRGMRRGALDGRVSTVDNAPTLARLLDLTPVEPLDGRVLTEALGGQD